MDFLDVLILLKLNNGMLSDYEILSHIQRRFNVPITPGTVYSCLHHLEKNKLIREVHLAKKKAYALTSKGKKRQKFYLACAIRFWGLWQTSSYELKTQLNFSQKYSS